MNRDDDQNWLDALAGREVGDSPTRREATALRAALLAAAHSVEALPLAGVNPHRERALLDAAAREGLLPRRAVRARWPWAMAAALVLALGLGVSLRWLGGPETIVLRGDDEGIVQIVAADPEALKQSLLRELRAAGVAATGYEALNVHGIDAELPLPLSDALRRVLAAHDIPEPADGALRIEIRSRE